MAETPSGGDGSAYWEAADHLRLIRELMERSTRYSTFSGLSGIFAGLVCIAGCLVQSLVVGSLPPDDQPIAFLGNWGIVAALAIAVDFLLTKRRAGIVGKAIISRLGREMLLASSPALGLGVLLTFNLVFRGVMDGLYPFWMMAYGAAVCAVGRFSQPGVSRLGWSMWCAGVITLVLQWLFPADAAAAGLSMMALSFGGFHIVYGIVMPAEEELCGPM